MTTLPSGGGPDGISPILVRKGEAVGYCIYAMHRRRDLYGEDAEQFRPERWDAGDESNTVNLKNIGWGYLPFNGGPRVCLGRKFYSSCFVDVPFFSWRICCLGVDGERERKGSMLIK
jgi:hypothetical protein